MWYIFTSAHRDKDAVEIIKERHKNAVDEALEDGFDLADLSKAPQPPPNKLRLAYGTQYLAYRLRSLNMYQSTSYDDKWDGRFYY